MLCRNCEDNQWAKIRVKNQQQWQSVEREANLKTTRTALSTALELLICKNSLH